MRREYVVRHQPSNAVNFLHDKAPAVVQVYFGKRWTCGDTPGITMGHGVSLCVGDLLVYNEMDAGNTFLS